MRRSSSARRAGDECADPRGADPLIAARRTGGGVHVVGREQLRERSAYRVDVRHVDGTAGSYYLDAQTALLTRARSRRALHPGQAVRVIEVFYDDYRPVSGVLYPFRALERASRSKTAALAEQSPGGIFERNSDAMNPGARCRGDRPSLEGTNRETG